MRKSQFIFGLCTAMTLIFASLLPLNAHALDSSTTAAADVPASLQGAWAASIDGKEAQLALWPHERPGYGLRGYLYIANHDCLMPAHVFSFDDEFAFGFAARGMSNRPANCDRNLMVAVPVFEGDGTITLPPDTDEFTAHMRELIIGTSLIPVETQEPVTITFRRVRPTDEFLDILTNYKHLYRPGPSQAFVSELRNQPVRTQRAAKSPADFAVTASGLQYKILSQGSGPHPKATDTVTVHYRGTLLDGREFDSSYSRGEPTSFPLNGVIPGWTEGLQLIQPGGKIKLIIPPELAYGSQGFGPIQPNATLIFEIELLAIQ